MDPADIVYTQGAANDFNSIFDYIAENSPGNAMNYIDKIQTAIESLSVSPFIGIHCRSKGVKRNCRILIFENYLIFYEFDETKNEVKILRIIHGARRYRNLLKT